MHIGFLSPTWPASSYANGVGTYVNAMRQGLIAQGHRVSVFTGHIETGQVDEGIYLIQRNSTGRALDVALRYFFQRDDFIYQRGYAISDSIRQVHRKNPFDVIEMEESFGWAATVASRTAIPTVVKLHGPAFLHLVEEELATPLGKEKVRREGSALVTLPVIISPSRSTLEKTVARYSLQPEIAQQVVNPVTLGTGSDLWRLEACARDTVLFVGRFDKVKGGDLILMAFKELLRRKPYLKLVFVGPDNGVLVHGGGLVHFKEFIAAQKDPALERSVVYRGRLSPAAVAEARTAALVTVIASRQENQPYTILEAMLQGCPVVSTDISGSNESVQHEITGLLALADDPADLARQIERIVDEPALGRTLGSAAREYVKNTHSVLNVVSQTVDVYRLAIANAATGARRRR